MLTSSPNREDSNNYGGSSPLSTNSLCVLYFEKHVVDIVSIILPHFIIISSDNECAQTANEQMQCISQKHKLQSFHSVSQ